MPSRVAITRGFPILAVLLPFVFGELMLASLSKLHLSPSMALTLVIAIFVGGLINIPVKSVVNHRDVVVHPLAVYGFANFWPELQRVHRETIIAVNVGGCLIPMGLVLYEIIQLAAFGRHALIVTATGSS